MKIAIRTDASNVIGSGHLMRCLTLARELRERGSIISFICSQAMQGRVLDNQNGFSLDWQRDAEEAAKVLKNRNYDWLIVYHYGLALKK